MVYYSDDALDDLDEIFVGLSNWDKKLEKWLISEYLDDILDTFDNLDKLSTHRKAFYNEHKKHGVYVFQHKKNKHSSWYACYNKIGSDIFIIRIISNYKTTS